MHKPYLIGICGGTGSGKTTLINNLKKSLQDYNVCYVSLDDYYKPREEQQLDEKGEKNFDLPESFKREKFKEDIKRLMKGEAVEVFEYNFNNPLKEKKLIKIEPAPVIIIEGIFVFHFEEIMEMLDLKIFIHASDSIKLIRRIRRDQSERNYPLEDVLYRYENHVNPTYLHYIEPYRELADIVINNNYSHAAAVDVLAGFIISRSGDFIY